MMDFNENKKSEFYGNKSNTFSLLVNSYIKGQIFLFQETDFETNYRVFGKG